MKKAGKQIIFYGALIGIWALLAKLHIWPPYLFPPPWVWGTHCGTDLRTTAFGSALW